MPSEWLCGHTATRRPLAFLPGWYAPPGGRALSGTVPPAMQTAWWQGVRRGQRGSWRLSGLQWLSLQTQTTHSHLREGQRHHPVSAPGDEATEAVSTVLARWPLWEPVRRRLGANATCTRQSQPSCQVSAEQMAIPGGKGDRKPDARPRPSPQQ